MNTTICAIATAQGGAIGIIRVSGPKAIDITDKIFNGRHSLLDAKGYSVHYGQIINILSGNNEEIDDVIVTVFRAPHSYTGEDSTEISCHASTYILNAVCTLLVRCGCEFAAPGEYTQRAFLNGKMDLSQAEAVADLIASQNAAQHRVAMSHMRGAISQKLTELREKLINLTSLLELELDFSDHEDLQFADRTQLLTLTQEIGNEISALLNSFSQGNAILHGIPVAIIGAPNVGKSTLLNALLQDDKAIVSDIQGTTRDTIEDTISINGTLFRFIDTAGIRHTDDTIERLGIERSIKAAERAQIIILMRDDINDYPTLTLRDNQSVIHINNKSTEFQAINGIGLNELKEKLISITSKYNASSDVLITNIRHKEILEQALSDVHSITSSISNKVPTDLIAEDIRILLHHLAEITGGEITSNNILQNIFRNFCIGK